MRIVYKGNYIGMTCGEIGLVYVSETRKLNRDFPLSLGRGKNDDPYSSKSKKSQ